MSREELQKFKEENDSDIFEKLDELMEASIAINNHGMTKYLSQLKSESQLLTMDKQNLNKEIESLLSGNINDYSELVKRVTEWKNLRFEKYKILYVLIIGHNHNILNGKANKQGKAL